MGARDVRGDTILHTLFRMKRDLFDRSTKCTDVDEYQTVVSQLGAVNEIISQCLSTERKKAAKRILHLKNGAGDVPYGDQDKLTHFRMISEQVNAAVLDYTGERTVLEVRQNAAVAALSNRARARSGTVATPQRNEPFIDTDVFGDELVQQAVEHVWRKRIRKGLERRLYLYVACLFLFSLVVILRSGTHSTDLRHWTYSMVVEKPLRYHVSFHDVDSREEAVEYVQALTETILDCGDGDAGPLGVLVDEITVQHWRGTFQESYMGFRDSAVFLDEPIAPTSGNFKKLPGEVQQAFSVRKPALGVWEPQVKVQDVSYPSRTYTLQVRGCDGDVEAGEDNALDIAVKRGWIADDTVALMLQAHVYSPMRHCLTTMRLFFTFEEEAGVHAM